LQTLHFLKKARLYPKDWGNPTCGLPNTPILRDNIYVFTHYIVVRQSYLGIYFKRKQNRLNNTIIRVSANSTTCLKTSRKIDPKIVITQTQLRKIRRRGNGGNITYKCINFSYKAYLFVP
jgi:hypothetical protein